MLRHEKTRHLKKIRKGLSPTETEQLFCYVISFYSMLILRRIVQYRFENISENGYSHQTFSNYIYPLLTILSECIYTVLTLLFSTRNATWSPHQPAPGCCLDNREQQYTYGTIPLFYS